MKYSGTGTRSPINVQTLRSEHFTPIIVEGTPDTTCSLFPDTRDLCLGPRTPYQSPGFSFRTVVFSVI